MWWWTQPVALVAALTLVAGVPALHSESPLEEAATGSLLLILDASGSMWGQIDGENKIVIARRVLGELVDGLADQSEVGVVAYGHRREGDCEDIETVVPMDALDRDALKQTVNALNPKGKTPITRSVEHAFTALAGRPGATTVILVSDGLETCGGDPCATVRAAKERGVEFLLHVVGFDVAGEDLSSLECAAQAGGGLFLSAENAAELSAALDQAVALPPEVPAGRLSVRGVADGELKDLSIHVSDAVTGEEVGGGRTYESPETNPRLIPLPDGRFKVEVLAVGLKGAPRREFEIEIVDGSTVEKVVDYSTGEIAIGVTRNGELSDAVYKVRLAGSGEEVASGRTYTGERSNPASVRITAGTYEVAVGSVEIAGKPWEELGTVTVEPGGRVGVAHEWVTGELRVGAARGGELIDATLGVVDTASGTSVGQGRTYTSERSNPKLFILPPGDYTVEVREIRGERSRASVTVTAGDTTTLMIDPGVD